MPVLTSRINQWIFSPLLLGLLWFILTQGNAESMTIGIPFVLLAAYTSQRFPGNTAWSVNLMAILRFLPWFLWNSLRGGFDVARRAVSPTVNLKPGFVSYPLNVPAGSARIFMINCVSLLPGTLSAELDGDTLVLDRKSVV